MRIVPWFPPPFRDRSVGGRVLAAAVAGLELTDPIVVGLAKGGVQVALEVARELEAPLTAVSVQRVNALGLRLGATTAEGPPYLRRSEVPEEVVGQVLDRARQAAVNQEKSLGVMRPPLQGRCVLLVDDGLVTGLTMLAACRWARAQGVAELVAATPVGHPDGLERLKQEADAVICPEVLEGLAVVGLGYDIFDPLEEWYVETLLVEGQEQRDEPSSI